MLWRAVAQRAAALRLAQLCGLSTFQAQLVNTVSEHIPVCWLGWNIFGTG
jgi:hypothetical protein